MISFLEYKISYRYDNFSYSDRKSLKQALIVDISLAVFFSNISSTCDFAFHWHKIFLYPIRGLLRLPFNNQINASFSASKLLL